MRIYSSPVMFSLILSSIFTLSDLAQANGKKAVVDSPKASLVNAPPEIKLPPATPVIRRKIRIIHTQAPVRRPDLISFEEAQNLLVPSQKYLIKFEDEESYGRVAANSASVVTTFSQSDVEKYRAAVEKIVHYRNHLRTRCSGESSQLLVQALEKYLASLSSFNRRALPIVADISENNDLLVLVVSRTTLTDAPILISRYLQFKKQRFKENMNRFISVDAELVSSLVAVANTLKVDLSEADWKKSFGVRDNALEALSLWPRESIFEATQKLTDARESACIVDSQPPVAVATPAE